jgi:4a-hydroxytetrahydrobiopterin dehydratase
MPDLTKIKCVPCEGGTPPLEIKEVDKLSKQTPGWKADKNLKLTRNFEFKNFRTAFSFLTQVALLAESEGHHPDFSLFSWNKVKIELSTHAIGGLSQNDFILAAKINKILEI